MNLGSYRCDIIYFITSLVISAPTIKAQQDIPWEQVLGGWVDDVYYENLFLGGAYYTRISLADIDGDEDLDMFYGGGDCGSLVFFENVGNGQEPVFQLGYEEFPGLRHRSLYGGTADADFGDLDNDGDLDAAFAPMIDRGGMVFWNDGDSINPDFVYRPPLGPLDGQSNVTLIDIDNDGDLDYFSGQGYRTFQMYFAENIGTPEIPQFIMRSRIYQNLNFGIPFNFDFADLDGDGDFDLLVCKHGGNIGYYENTGTPEEPDFVLLTDDFLPDRDTTDWMETPEFADIDADGDLDLFLAGAYAHFYYFENIGSSQEYQFIQRSDTSFFYNIPYMAGALLGNSVDIDGDGDQDLAPGTSLFLNESFDDQIRFSRVDFSLPFVVGAFADMDADGDYDYIIPGGINSIGYFENIGDTSWPVWDDIRDLFPDDGHLSYIWSVTAGDMDNDGDEDLLVGHDYANPITYYRNDGTPDSYDFVFAGQMTLPQWESYGIYDALLGDIDIDGDLDLLIGDTRFGDTYELRLLFYRNDGTPEQYSWTFVTDDFQNAVSEHRNGSLAPCLADVDNDGDNDLVLTNNGIGMQLFLNPLDPTAVEDSSRIDQDNAMDFVGIKCFPNPVNSTIRFSIGLPESGYGRIYILNILGQSISEIHSGEMSAGENTFYWDTTPYASGIYFIAIKSRENTVFSRFTILK